MIENAFPLVAAAGTVNAFVSFVIAARLFFSYRRTRSLAQGHFLLFYLYFGVFYFYFATTQLFLSDDSGETIGIFHVISYFFLYLSIGYVLSFPLILERKEILAQHVLLGVLVFNVIFLALRVIAFEPSVREQLAQYLYWRPVFPEWMRILTGIISIATAVFISSFFYRQGWRRRSDRFVYRRSLLLGSGFALLLFAALLSFIAAPSGSFAFVVTATFLVLVGLLVILRGVYYRDATQLRGNGEAEGAPLSFS